MTKCCDPRAPRTYKVKVGDNLVGIVGLDLIIAGVRSLEPLSKEAVKSELLKQARAYNYIPDSAGEKYVEALYREYLKKLNEVNDEQQDNQDGQPGTIKILGTGCPKCIKLEKIVKEAIEELGRDLSVEKVTDLDKITSYGVAITPGLMLGGKVVSTGRVPAKKEIINWIKEI
jgi:small redox-active disulfide protein 2